jgi:hypothetical protein
MFSVIMLVPWAVASRLMNGRLQIGGESWEGLGTQIDGPDRLGAHAESESIEFDSATRFLQLVDHGPQMLRHHRGHIERGAGDGGRQQEGAGFDAIGDHRVIGPVQLGYTIDRDGWRACSTDPGAHGQQEIGQIDDFGFLSGVIDGGFPFGEGRGHHQGFGGSRHWGSRDGWGRR